MNADNGCYICGCLNGKGKNELRPYGEGGKPICAGCGLNPEHERQSFEQFAMQLEFARAAGGGVAMLADGELGVPDDSLVEELVKRGLIKQDDAQASKE